MKFNYQTKYLIIIFLVILLFLILCKSLMLEKFDSEIENVIQTTQSIDNDLDINIQTISQKQFSKVSPSGAEQNQSQLSRDLTYNINDRFNTTKSVYNTEPV